VLDHAFVRLVAYRQSKPGLMFFGKSTQRPKFPIIQPAGAFHLDRDFSGTQNEVHLQPGLRSPEMNVVMEFRVGGIRREFRKS
jgi:hypothetical protein